MVHLSPHLQIFSSGDRYSPRKTVRTTGALAAFLHLSVTENSRDHFLHNACACPILVLSLKRKNARCHRDSRRTPQRARRGPYTIFQWYREKGTQRAALRNNRKTSFEPRSTCACLRIGQSAKESMALEPRE